MAAASELREKIRILLRTMGVLERGGAHFCELSLGQCHALVEIGRTANLTLLQLADTLQLDKSTVSRLIDKLVQDGLVIRKENPTDRRYNSLMLSAKGIDRYQSVENKMNSHFSAVLAAIPAAQRQQVIDSVGLLQQSFALLQKKEQEEEPVWSKSSQLLKKMP